MPRSAITLAGAVLDLVLPGRCAVCSAAARHSVLCPPCRARLAEQLYTRPQRARPVPEPPDLPVVHAAGEYAGVLGALVAAHKDEARWDASPLLGLLLAASVAQSLRCLQPGPGEGADAVTSVVLVPMPSSRASRRRRGEWPAARLAHAAVHELRRSGLPARVEAVLTPGRATGDQRALGAQQRAANVRGAFAVDRQAAGRLLRSRGGPATLVLVDDVMTTGASMSEAAAVLTGALPARSPAVRAAVVAATRRRSSMPAVAAGHLSQRPARY